MTGTLHSAGGHADKKRMRSLFRGPPSTSLLLNETEAPFVRLVLGFAVFGGLVFGGMWWVNREPVMLLGALFSMVNAIVAATLIVIGRERALLALAPSYPGLLILGTVAESDHVRLFAALCLVLGGSVAIVFMNGRTGRFLALYAVVLFGAESLWLGWGAAAWIDGGIMVAAFLVGSLGMEWIRAASMDAASRFLNLFERAPVSLWEEDFSEVGEWLEGLKAKGVIDLRGYLNANRPVLERGMKLIEVVRVNRAAARFLEVADPTDLVGKLRPETFPDDSMPSLLAQFEAIWDGRDQVTVEVNQGHTVQGNNMDGLLHWTVPRRLGSADLSRVIVSVVDVTEMNNTRRRLEQSLRSKDELIAAVSHELRTPLTTVVGLSSELSDSFDEFEVDEVRDLLEMISAQSMEVAAIVEDLLAAARAESGSLRVAMTLVDLHLEVKTTLRGLDIEQEVDCHTIGVIPPVYADSGRVRQILRNLLVNAKRYGTAPMRVVVLDTGDDVCVEVRDHGTPIPDDEVEQIFERYYRARQTPGVAASVGLGLTVSRELARLMGGDLTYHHDGESVFTLELPRSVPARVAS